MAHLAFHLFFCFCIWLYLRRHLPARAAAAAMIDSISNDAFQSWEDERERSKLFELGHANLRPILSRMVSMMMRIPATTAKMTTLFFL
jgi:hypothetical protein